jgi:DNA-binding transcriptional MerR regulator/predicted transcriptional regulator
MKINEVSKLTGLSQKTIRYYKERGLIEPMIQLIGNRNFRDYSEQTVTRLTSIATLRKLFFSIDEIILLINKPDQIDSLLEDYQKRLENELQEKAQILKTISTLEYNKIENIDSLSGALTTIAYSYDLPPCDSNPDFSKMDRAEPDYSYENELRINTKHSILAKKANGLEMFILELLWDKSEMDFNTIAHKCLERSILPDSDAVYKTLKRMCRRKLIQYRDSKYEPLVTQSNIEFRNFDLMIQTAYNGSPSKMIYTPPATPTSFGGGGGGC